MWTSVIVRALSKQLNILASTHAIYKTVYSLYAKPHIHAKPHLYMQNRIYICKTARIYVKPYIYAKPYIASVDKVDDDKKFLMQPECVRLFTFSYSHIFWQLIVSEVMLANTYIAELVASIVNLIYSVKFFISNSWNRLRNFAYI